MIRALIGIAATLAMTGTLPGTAAPHGLATRACSAGMHQVTVGGRPGFRFCGPASAVVHLGARTLRFSNGICRQAADAFSVNIGTLVPGLRSGKPASFGITTHTAKPGRQLNAAVGFAYGGRMYAIADQVVILAPGLTGGAFSGRILGTTMRVTGSFTC